MSDIKPQSLYMRDWRKNNPDKVKINNKKHYWNNHKKRLLIGRVAYDNLRYRVFEIIGFPCVKCGFYDHRCMQLDHVFGDGNLDIKKHGSHGKMLRYYRDHPNEAKKKLQPLCANCNWIKKYNKYEVTRKAYNYNR